ncbi:MAG TPA: AraC family transcriptional regulator [Paracoccaceae bacterium]|nr:AraC family transcriptional regulator [Paracoccaceae bacterium]
MARHHDRASESLAGASIRGALAAASGAGVPGAPVPAADPLSDVLRQVKLTGALFFMVEASIPWGVEVPRARAFASVILPRAQHVISYHIILRGSGWITGPTERPVPFAAGDILVLPHEDRYAMLSAPEQRLELTEADSVAFFRAMAAGELPFTVAEGGGGAGGARYVCGFLGCDARPFNPLLATLPRLIHVRRPEGAGSDLLDYLIELTLAEARARRAGSDCIRLALSELMFVEVVRRYLDTLPEGGAGWLAGLRDPAIGRVLALLHARPADPWSVETLARTVGLSRSVLAERFAQLVGQPPMQYLTLWRIQLAARKLVDGGAKVAAIGEDVGFASEAAFSRCFKRITGVSPTQWRRPDPARAGPPAR